MGFRHPELPEIYDCHPLWEPELEWMYGCMTTWVLQQPRLEDPLHSSPCHYPKVSGVDSSLCFAGYATCHNGFHSGFVAHGDPESGHHYNRLVAKQESTAVNLIAEFMAAIYTYTCILIYIPMYPSTNIAIFLYTDIYMPIYPYLCPSLYLYLSSWSPRSNFTFKGRRRQLARSNSC